MKEFMAYLDTKITEGKAEIAALEAGGRKDDANFARVRMNIYDVCRTVSRTLADKPGAGTGAIKAQLDRFRAVWGEALEKAKARLRANVSFELTMELLLLTIKEN